MQTRRAAFLTIGIVVLGLVSSAIAQTGARSTLYRLTGDAYFQRGCFDPCLCPLMIQQPVRGTFRLVSVPSPDPFDARFEIVDVNWRIDLFGTPVRVTGSGTYRVGGDFALTEQLVLDLRIGDEERAHFDSGTIVGQSQFPAINLLVSQNGMFCFDTVFNVAAVPVPARQITPYRLSRSSLTEGCFEGCRCAIFIFDDVSGGFSLVSLGQHAGWNEYAVVDANWLMRSQYDPSPNGRRATGYGLYRVAADSADRRNQQLEMELSVDGAEPAHFDSGVVPGGESFANINIAINRNNLYCYDQLFDLHARPYRRIGFLADFSSGREPIQP